MNILRNMDPAVKKILPRQKLLPGIEYIPSQFSYSFEHNAKRYVSNTLTRQVIEGKLPERCKTGEGYDEYIESYFLVPADKDECAFYLGISAIMRTLDHQKGYKAYTILPTYDCNARCVYCYEEGRKPVTMTPEIVDQLIRFILDSRSNDQLHLGWYGGEPLLCTDIIDRVCKEIHAAGVEYTSSMISNGSLITPEIVQKMVDEWKLKHIQISMDGTEEEYICRKKYCHYDGYYQKVIRSVDLMSQSGIPVAIRCNIDENNIEDIPTFIDDLKKRISHKDRVTVYFCLLNDRRLKKNETVYWAKILAAKQLIAAAGFKAENMGGTGREFRIVHCMADKGNVVISPDGGLYPCEHCPDNARYGDVFHGTVDEQARKEFCRTDRVRNKCRHCPFLPECTAFSHCQVQDISCREFREMVDIQVLTDLVDHREEDTANAE